MQISKHFTSEEFECKCGCGFNNISSELVEVLEELRDIYRQPIIINSGCRCEQHNKNVGGEEGSKHLLGIAVDFNVRGSSPAKVYQYLDRKYHDKYGIGQYKTWVHLDVRKEKARWSK